jgi:hypothetical protein
MTILQSTNNKKYNGKLHSITQADKKEIKQQLLSDYSATTSYCQHTGVKLVIGTEFQQTSLRGKFLKHEHPIFSLSTNRLFKVIGQSFNKCNPTEKYLLMVAFMRQITTNTSGTKQPILDTSKHPLLLEENVVIKLSESFYYLVKAYEGLSRSNQPLPVLPVYRVDFELSQNASALIAFVKRVTNLLDQASNSWIKPEATTTEKLDDEIQLEQQLKKILNNYNSASRPKAYSSKLGKWAVKQLVIVAPHLKDDKIASISYYIQCTSLNLDEELLKEYIGLLSDVLPMDEMHREMSLLVITHLKSKLSNIYKELENYGFDLIEDEEIVIGTREATEDKEAIAGIKVKSKRVVSNRGQAPAKIVPTSNRQTFGAGDALSRMMAKFNKTKAPEVVTVE